MNPSLYVVFPYDVPQPIDFDSQIDSQGFYKRHMCYFLTEKNLRIVHVTLVEGRVLALALDLEANQLSFFWEAELSPIHTKKF